MSILAEKSLDRPVMNKYETLFHRHPSNPILTGKDWPYSMNSVFNAGATLLPDGSTLLLCRVEDRRGLSHLCVARSANGVDGWQIDREPTFIPDVERFPEELWGVEDPRTSNMPWLILRIRVAVPECLWHSRKIFAYSRNSVSSCRRTTKTRPFCPEGLTALGL
jgi:hypothetical protein